MAGANTLEFNESNFESEVVNSSVPVLVDFWAEWCMPCKALGPTIDELADDYAGKAKIGKVNTETSATLASQFGISAIPTVLLFHNGEVKEQFVGLRSKQDFAMALDGLLGG